MMSQRMGGNIPFNHTCHVGLAMQFSVSFLSGISYPSNCMQYSEITRYV